MRLTRNESFPNSYIFKKPAVVYPPKKSEVFEYLEAECAKLRIDIGLDIDKQPDKEWMIEWLYAIKPDHAMFKKDFRPKPKSHIRSSQSSQSDFVIENKGGFFDGVYRLTEREAMVAAVVVS